MCNLILFFYTQEFYSNNMILYRYRTVQNFDGTNFQQFINIFSIKIFRLVSYLYKMNE